MSEKWTQEERDNARRIVMFSRSQNGSQIQVNFRGVCLAERPLENICISCIYWADYQDYFVTSFDVIYLQEQLLVLV